MAELRTFQSREILSVALADQISGVLTDAISRRGDASLVVSGGTSPLAMFSALRRQVLPWKNVVVVPSDERLVPVDHEDSNEGMIRRELMQEEAATAQLLSFTGTGEPYDKYLENLNSQLGRLRKPLDMVVLGMGDDGHTASLFPDSPNIAEALSSTDFCVVQRPAHLEVGRMSLSPVFLLDARQIVLLFFGFGKRAVYDRAMAGQDVAEMPVRFLLHQQAVPVVIFWAP